MTAFRRSTPETTVAAPVVDPSAAPIALIENADPETDQFLAIPAEFFEDKPAVPSSNGSEFDHAPFFEDASAVLPSTGSESRQIATIAQHDESFNFFDDQDPDFTIHPQETDLLATSDAETLIPSDQTRDEVAALIVTEQTQAEKSQQEPEYAQPDAAHLSKQGWSMNEAFGELREIVDDAGIDSLSTHSNQAELEHTQQPPVDHASVNASVDTPVANWDYSQGEWPVLVVPTQPRVFNRRTVITAVILMALAASIYFLILRPSSPDRPTASSASIAKAAVATEPGAPVGEQPNVDARKPESTTNAPTDPSPALMTVSAQPVGAAEDSGQSKFSLQAAAYPNAGGADEFAEKLKRAGVPSYVVPADIARRGRWFRVRVGRFNTADEAQKFAGEAQLRARAAGLTLQLIVCQYDQP